jgi:Flp pilus assembly protein TadG
MRRATPSFASDARGLAGVEFALIAPVLAVMILIISDGALYLLRNHDMRAAVSSAAQYVMQTGTNADMSTAQSVALAAWTSKPVGATVAASNACLCGATASACSTLCSDNSVPQSFTTISASSTYTGAILKTQTLTASEVVRVR